MTPSFRDALDRLRDQWCPTKSYPEYIQGATRQELEYFEPFSDLILAHAHEFSTHPIVLLTVCSYAKPYSNSFIHYEMRKALYKRQLLDMIEIWHLSSGGVIPTQLEKSIPWVCYDWNNEEASEDDLAALRGALTDRFIRWMQIYGRGKKQVVTYFRPESNTARAIESSSGIASLSNVTSVIPECVDSQRESLRSVTLDGVVDDPDAMLILPINLKLLTDVLARLVSLQE